LKDTARCKFGAFSTKPGLTVQPIEGAFIVKAEVGVVPGQVARRLAHH